MVERSKNEQNDIWSNGNLKKEMGKKKMIIILRKCTWSSESIYSIKVKTKNSVFLKIRKTKKEKRKKKKMKKRQLRGGFRQKWLDE